MTQIFIGDKDSRYPAF